MGDGLFEEHFWPGAQSLSALINLPPSFAPRPNQGKGILWINRNFLIQSINQVKCFL